ncbi:MAG: bifunctional (p)ppGpp synthetase/guanosine-3',5'-bis(diphosphate) 3'-pyrophosphohydrolase [Planctomycetales bacterium]|nr:bifunctional (p)ppGpp synthetase/guanosine-3',5'-bis(diphosphate) 3'-pyrophosphohydrolase [Planctomycetales bacterium]
MFSSLIERALRVAADAHRHQHRKASDIPYLTHPVSVMVILQRAGFHDEELLAAAALHDVVEDTPRSLVDLAADFPPRVLELVACLTERKRGAAGQPRSWQDRKREHIEQVAAGPWEARAIVLADKLHNLATIAFDLDAGQNVWPRFNAPAQQFLDYHRTMVDRAEQADPRLASLATECRRLINELA